MLDKPQRHGFGFTFHEMQILQLVAQGLSNKEIAREFDRSARTIETQMHTIQKKMGTNNRAHAAALAVGLGMVQIVTPLRTQNELEPDATAADRTAQSLLSSRASYTEEVL